MTKSVRGSTLSQCAPQRKKGLEIVTLNESLQAHQQTLQQPTATFAMQRQKETAPVAQNFIFRNRSGQRYR
jgi:hypothetical protein